MLILELNSELNTALRFPLSHFVNLVHSTKNLAAETAFSLTNQKHETTFHTPLPLCMYLSKCPKARSIFIKRHETTEYRSRWYVWSRYSH